MLRVLLVDDSELYRLTFGAVLEDAGHAVTQAGSVAEAGARLRQDRFDLVVLDLQLGDGSGTSLVPAIRRLQPASAIALVSGSAGDLPPLGREEAVDLVLAKGDDPAALLQSLARLVERAR